VNRVERPATKAERGAAAVELALVLPLLLLILFGIIEFGRGYEVKVQLTGSVREGARSLALGESQAEVEQAVIDAAPGLNPALTPADISMTPCPPGGADGDATVTVTYDLPSLTPLVPSGVINIDVTGVMRCGL
jgi:Flp pilus assembly protein TadG